MEKNDICRQREGKVMKLFCRGCLKEIKETFQQDLCKDCLQPAMDRGTATINTVVNLRKKHVMVANNDYPRTIA
jgi:hypothetical protein